MDIKRSVITGCAMMAVLIVAPKITADNSLPNLQLIADPSGILQTFSTVGAIDESNAFFQNLGTNGRTCNSCQQASDAWSISAAHIQARFESDGGLDPIFRPVDGANCPTADVSTVEARRASYSLLLSKGLIRISLGVPANAEFVLSGIDDPYACATSGNLSLYRRPLPSTNLGFLSTVMWDGRETVKGQSIADDLKTQSNDATTGHAQGAIPLTDAQRQQIVAFETTLFTAQARDNAAGILNAQGGNGGPKILSTQPFFIGINDPLGHNPTGAAFDPNVFTIFQAWANLTSSSTDPYSGPRASVARGEALFNTRPISITGVAGLNDDLNLPVITGTCTTCHDTPNAGDHSVPAPLNIGLVDATRRTPDMPLYTFLCNAAATVCQPGETKQVTDPGRALVTGKWKDIGRFKGPILRGLAARAPYFHNGSAATLMDAVNFYDTRFQLGLSSQEKSDLVAFLSSL